MASEKEKKAYHAKNVNRLKELGLSDADIQTYKSLWNNYINDDEYNRIVSDWNTKQESNQAKQAEFDARTPDVLKNDPSFQGLPMDMKEVVLYNYEIQKANDKQKADNLSKALEMATAQADPYWKNMLLIAQDEVLRSFEQAQGDYESSVQRQQNIIQNINQDLMTNKDFLSLEQQSELANLKMNYEVNQERLIEGAANQGLTFSTKRKIAEQRLSEENQGIVESTNRRYNKQLTDLQTASARGSEDAQKEIEDLQRRMGDYTTNIGRSGEKYLGSENLPSLPGYTPIGNIAGDMYEQKVSDIESRKQAIANELNQSSLNY